MSVAPAKVRFEIFREPGFFDDSFAKGWTQTSGVAAFDGETATVYGYYAFGCAEKSLPNLVVTTYQLVQVRVTEVAGSGTKWGVKVYDGSSWLDVFSNQSGVGVFESFIPATGNPLTKIALLEETVGDLSNCVVFDYVVICKGAMLVPDLGDAIEELYIVRPLLNNGISSMTVTFQNFSGAYNGLIKDNDIIIAWLARADADLGTVAPKAFGGRVVLATNVGKSYGEFYISLECHGHAYELNIPPALFKATYTATNGRTIIEAALALCTYLARHPAGNFWFDSLGPSGSTDDEIDSTHDVIYDEEVPMTAIQEILEKAVNPDDEQGFDVYETPAGCLIGHLRNSVDFKWIYSTLTPRTYKKSFDLHRVRNTIKVYGKRGKPYPTDEGWTESTAGYTIVEGALGTDADRIIGTCSLKGTASASANMRFYRTFSALNANPKTFKTNFNRLCFLLKLSAVTGGGLHVRLYAPDSSNYFDYPLWQDRDYSADPGVLAWTPIELKTGPDYETVFESKGMWTKGGTPDWANIQGINFFFILGITNYALFDDLKFMDTFYSGEATDPASILAYGIRCAKPVYDDALKTDAECLARAESIKATLKDPVITLSDVVVDGDYWMDPGVLTRVIVANDALDDYFRIVQVKHVVKGTQWDATLTLSNEPQYVDYVFKLIQEAQKLLERRS